MSYTLAQLKRDCNEHKIKAEMVIRCGGTNIPERLAGIRPLVSANSVSITFLNADGAKSEMPIKRAALIDYDNEHLTIYYPGVREPNTEEQSVLDAWKKITETEDYKNRSYTDALTDGSSTYWQEKAFFNNSPFPYLFGVEESQGKMMNRGGKNHGMITDYSIRGDIEMQYKIYR